LLLQSSALVHTEEVLTLKLQLKVKSHIACTTFVLHTTFLLSSLSCVKKANLQGISPEIVNLALQNGIIPSTLNAATLPTASLDITCPGQTPSTSFGAIVSNHSLNVPFFESDAFKNVNLNVAPSSLLNGLDLPTDDVTTLRFFYNLGVQSLRNYQCITNSSSLPHVTQCVSTTANQISLGSLQNEQQAKMLQCVFCIISLMEMITVAFRTFCLFVFFLNLESIVIVILLLNKQFEICNHR
uniref:Peptidase S1 domain-containing protein n=1 Tax=Syphacia muris TaxID=451379 RepID=A0A0N5ARS6_9BILA